MTLSKGQGGQFVAALLKAFPPARSGLHWTLAMHRNRCSVAPPEHHRPLSWPLTLAMAASLCYHGRSPDAILLMVQWRLGLRPGEAYQLLACHIFLPPGRTSCGIVKVGAVRGTKVRREQFVRVHPSDHITWFLLERILCCRRQHERIGRWTSTQSQNYWLRKCCKMLDIPELWSAHSPRAGWATWRHVSGQSVESLMMDGRWASHTSLRVYLDALGSLECDSLPQVRALSRFIASLEQDFFTRYYWF